MVYKVEHILEIQCLKARIQYLETLENFYQEQIPVAMWNTAKANHEQFHKPSDFIKTIKDVYGDNFK